MRAIINFIKGTFITVWAVIAIFTTICLLATNKFLVSEFGDYSLFIVDNRSLEPTFEKNDIVIATKALEQEYNVGDKAFFYYENKEAVSFINLGEITKVERIDRVEDKFTFSDINVSYGNMIGLANKTLVIHKWGLLLRVFESKWGFMFLVILPTLFAIVYEIYVFVMIVNEDTKKQLSK